MKLIYCHGRSGSTQLVRAARKLEGSGRFYDEPFKQRNAKAHGYDKIVRENGNLEDYISYLNPLRVKHLWTDLPKDMNRRLVHNPSVDSILFLYRRGVVDYTLSMVTANITKEWHGASVRLSRDIPIEDICKTADDIIEAVPNNALMVSKFAQSSVCCVAYEDLYGFSGADIQRQAARKAFQSLGIRDEAFISSSIDTMLTNEKKYKGYEYYREIFKNFDEAISALKKYDNFYEKNKDIMPENIITKYSNL